ncbi:MAG TPA: four helix bundle protein [Candidatus Omnitrophica bacterium]|nr:four helix bundle protein [Candidatus Omnitrophota bacterium]
MNNIAEGFDSQSDNELKRFLRISRRSASEVENCFYISSDLKYITDDELGMALEQSRKTREIIDGFLRYLSFRKAKPAQPANGINYEH